MISATQVMGSSFDINAMNRSDNRPVGERLMTMGKLYEAKKQQMRE